MPGPPDERESRVTGPGAQPRWPLPLRLWLAAGGPVSWLLARLARKAHRRQGAPAERLGERFGRPTLPRPAGRLIWLHAASVGEVVSAAGLVAGLRARTGAAVLVTTNTATGAETVARRLPGAVHQFYPLDTPEAVAGFLDHWRPDAALFIEGDLWPGMVRALTGRAVPMALINARASRSRARFPASFGALLAPMALVTAQEETVREGLIGLGLDPGAVHAPGNLKADIAPPPVDDALRARIAGAAPDRAVWAAVSTHPGEEEIVLGAHARLPGGPLLLLVPRHPGRGEAVAGLIRRAGLRYTRHSAGERPDAATQVHLIDTLGDTGTAYAAAGVALVGGSLVPGIGGHTPYEPASLGRAVLSGPHLHNFAGAYAGLQAAGAARQVGDGPALARTVTELLADPPALAAMQQAASAEYARARGATERTLRLLAPLLQDAG